MSLEELFRQKLESAEVIPSVSANAKIMRKVAGREFVRFNPARFNAFYLGAILVTGITASILIFGSKDKTPSASPENPVSVILNSTNTESVSISAKPELNNTSSVTEIREKVAVKDVSAPAGKPASANSTGNVKTLTKPESESQPVARGNIDPGKIIENSIVSENRLLQKSKVNEVVMDASSIEGCLPLKVLFQNKTSVYDSCRWTFGDGGNSVEKNPSWIFDVEGEYKVVLSVFFHDGTMLTSHVLINVHPKPVSGFEINPENALIPDDEIVFYNYSLNAIKYNWEFGDGATSSLFEPHHRYTRFGKYNVRLVAISDYGCTDTLIISNAFSGSGFYINFPNAFIPNPQGPSGGISSSKSDESAQIFHPESSGVTDYQLRIFSKRGILIFESNDVNLGWDGYFKGKLSDPGVYIWKVRGKFRNGEPFIKMGDVTLLKY